MLNDEQIYEREAELAIKFMKKAKAAKCETDFFKYANEAYRHKQLAEGSLFSLTLKALREEREEKCTNG